MIYQKKRYRLMQKNIISSWAACGMIVFATVLSGCGERELVLKGERESILQSPPELSAENDALGEGAGLPEMVLNTTAGHPGITASHAGGNLELSPPFSVQWRARVTAPDEKIISLPQAVIENDRVLALGADATLHAFDIENGKTIWQTAIDDAERGIYPGRAGGVALQNGVVAAHAARLELTVIDSLTGEITWQITHDAPLQAGPTFIGDDAILVSDIEGQLYAYAVKDGELLWENAGLPVSTVVFGAAFPAVHADMVVIAGSGGELSVHNTQDATLLWAETLASLNPKTPLEELSDILAHPIHDGQNIIVASQSGRLALFDALTGLANWEQPIALTQMPWLAGETLFAVSVNGVLYALRKSDGAVRWQVELAGSVADSARAGGDLPHYQSPFVGAGQVHILSQNGVLYSFDADTGEQVSSVSLRREVQTSPQIANGAVFVLSQNGNLMKLQ